LACYRTELLNVQSQKLSGFIESQQWHVMEVTIKTRDAWICCLCKTSKQFFKWHWWHVHKSNIS